MEAGATRSIYDVGMMLRMGWEDVCVCASCFTYDSEKELLCRLPTSRISYLWSGATKQFMRKYVEAPNVFHLQFPPWTPPRSWAPPPPTRAPTGSTGWASPSWASATTAASSPLTLRTSTGTPPPLADPTAAARSGSEMAHRPSDSAGRRSNRGRDKVQQKWWPGFLLLIRSTKQ
ncbi:uncharacterized protein [Aegilops tauschii subsp. strangulata]|uniref:uncharacterized protein isoform X2 n=1 Tax=Aegilops tauschii subsp. strangulata TaxID=200361 RepID=UPI003CC8AC56